MKYDKSKVTPGTWRIERGQWADHSDDGGGGFTLYMRAASLISGQVKSAHLIPMYEGWHEGDAPYPEMEANAAHIATCVNNHDRLVDALEMLTNRAEGMASDQGWPSLWPECEDARALLKELQS